MFSALFWKHVRQARGIFWGGLAAAVLLPPLCLLLAAGHVKLPLRIGVLETTTVMGEFTTRLMLLVVLPVVTIAVGLQVFGGDLAAHTEPFVIERPASRPLLWTARLAAALAVCSVQVVAGVTVWEVLFRLTTALTAETEVFAKHTLVEALLVVLGMTLLYMAGPLVAVSVGATGVSGFVLSLLVVVMLGWQGYLFMTAFMQVPGYWWEIWGFGGSFALAVTWAVATHAFGEPGGRARWLRGPAMLACAGCLLVPTFLAGATLLVRQAPSRVSEINPDVRPSASGRAVLVGGLSSSRAWLFGVGDGARRAFLPPPVYCAAWNADGSVLAIVTAAGPFGSHLSGLTLRTVRPDGTDAFPPILLVADRTAFFEHADEMTWAGEYVAVRANNNYLWLVRPRDHYVRFAERDYAFRMLGAGADGSVYFVSHGIGAEVQIGRWFVDLDTNYWRGLAGPNERDTPYQYQKANVAVVRWRVDARVPDTVAVLPERKVDRIPDPSMLSRSGRLLFLPEAGGPSVHDLVTQQTVPFGCASTTTKVRWLDGERLLWFEKAGVTGRLLIARAGEVPHEIRAGLTAPLLDVSPDGRRVLVTDAEWKGETRTPLAYALYDATTDRWTDLAPLAGAGATLAQRMWWASDDTLLRARNDVVELVPLNQPGNARRIWN